MRSLVAVLAAFSCACHCGGGGDPDAGRKIEIARFRTLISAAGREDVPFDLEQAELSAIVFDDAGARVVYPAVTGAGAATFSGVPDGGYVLRLGGYNLVTAEDRLDLGVAGLGRASAGLSDGAGTVLRLDVSGLEPWQPYSDVLQLTAENAGYVALNAQAFAGEQPDAGVDSASFPVDYGAACNTQRGQLSPLIDADAGDFAVLTQLASAEVPDAGMLQLRRLVRAATLPAFTVVDGAQTAVAAALMPVATQEHLSLDFRQSAFEALTAAVHPMAQPLTSTVTVSALPFSVDDGFFTAAPDLAVLRPQNLKRDVALELDTGNPFPASWAKVVTVRYGVQVDYAYPDGGYGRVSTPLVTQELLSAVAGMPLVPRVSPPRALKIDGADGLVRAQISRVPRLSWDPPATGTPTSYAVTIYLFSRTASGAVISGEESYFETLETSLKLPFGEVTPGEQYVFAVTAIAAPGTEPGKRPFRGKFPYAAATALTALMPVDPTLSQP